MSLPRIVKFEDKYFSYSKSKTGQVSCDVELHQLDFLPASLAVPQVSRLAQQCTVQARVLHSRLDPS